MDRRTFTRSAGSLVLGSVLIPFPMNGLNQSSAELIFLKDEAWFVNALTTFAKYAALDKLAEHTWEYLFNKLRPVDPEKPVVDKATSMMKKGGFNNFYHSPVYQNNYYGTVLYDAATTTRVKDVCVGVTRTGIESSTPLMLDGPAIGMIGFTAQSAAESGFSPNDIRGMLFPSGKVKQGSTGNLQTGYAVPIEYETKEGKKVAIGYQVKDGIGKGEIAVADIRGGSLLTHKAFEFPVS